MKGWVYIATNESLPGLLKIGYSDRHPDQRMAELSNTSVPSQYECVHAVLCTNPKRLEALIHDNLEGFRVSSNREFFKVAKGVAIEALNRLAKDSNNKIFYRECPEEDDLPPSPKNYPDGPVVIDQTLTDTLDVYLTDDELRYGIYNALQDEIRLTSEKLQTARDLANSSGNTSLAIQLTSAEEFFYNWQAGMIDKINYVDLIAKIRHLSSESFEAASEFSVDIASAYYEQVASKSLHWWHRLNTLNPRCHETLAYDVVVEVEDFGVIVLRLLTEDMSTLNNFLGYVEEGHYDETLFHRVVKGQYIQGGGFNRHMHQVVSREPFADRGSHRSNKRYTVAMVRNAARLAQDQFFINCTDNPHLDGGQYQMFSGQLRWIENRKGHAVFAEVIDGYEIVDAISEVATFQRQEHQYVPIKPVIIKRVRLR